MENTDLRKKISNSIEVSLRLIFLFILLAWCLALLVPFIIPVLWGVIIAVSIAPLFSWLSQKLGNRKAWAAGIITIVLLAVILVPVIFLFASVADDVHRIGEQLVNKQLNIPPPKAEVADWPLVGKKVYAAWDLAARQPEVLIAKYGDQIRTAGKWFIGAALGLTGDIMKLMLSIIIAGVLLATPGTKEFTYKFFIKMVGDQGEEFTMLTEKTIRNVTKGILGVAVIQSSMLALLFFFAGVPYVGLLFVICLALGIMQLPAVPVSIFAIVWLFNNGDASTTMNLVWTALILLAGLADNVLKPILLGKGAPVPMLVIFLGAIGGFIFSGFLGLFTGAIVLSLGYRMFITWLSTEVINDPIN